MATTDNGDICERSTENGFGSPDHGAKQAALLAHQEQSLEPSVFRLQATEDYFQTISDKSFYGTYGRVRRKLDYGYHKHYKKERQWLHDSIIEHFFENECTDLCWRKPAKPWLIFTAGAPGAKIRKTIDTLLRSNRLPLLSYVYVDPHEIGQLLPEYSYFIQSEPTKAKEHTSKESEYIAQTLTIAALQDDRNVFLDGCLHDVQWYKNWIVKLRKEFCGLRVAVLYFRAETKTLLHRAFRLTIGTQKIPSDEEIIKLNADLSSNFEAISDAVDFSCTIKNETTPELVDKDWETFMKTFSQTSTSESPMTSKEDVEEFDNIRKKISLHKPFSVLASTEENHSWDKMIFVGPYADIRESLDYSYHKNYTIDRQRFQDAIIKEFLTDLVLEDKDGEICTTPTEPWIVFTAGAMGAGKSYTLRKLVEKNRFPLIAFVNVDPDKIRRKLPEFHLYVSANPDLAGELTRKEAGYVSEILALAGLYAGKNVIVDGSLRDAEWYKVYFQRLRDEFPNSKIAILHITAPQEAVFERAANRAKKTGRVIPNDVLKATLEQVPRSVEELKPLVDYCATLNNPPDTDDVELVSPEVDWDSFARNWIQTCAWIPNDKRRMQQKKQFVVRKLSENAE